MTNKWDTKELSTFVVRVSEKKRCFDIEEIEPTNKHEDLLNEKAPIETKSP